MPAKKSDSFGALGLSEPLIATLTELGYEEPTPIQREAIPPLLEGRDLIGQAATGTGKTAAFALPLIERLVARGKKRGQPSALVLVPTRELAMQVAEAVHRYGRAQRIQALPIYGGQGYDRQLRALERGVDIVVATPGRALDHIGRGTLNLSGVADVVLDEADEMLDMGFLEDIEAILGETPAERQTVLFSATLPPRIASIAKRYLKDPVKITIARDPVKAGAVPKVRQTAYIVGRSQKLLALGRLLDLESPTSAIVFCRTRNEVDELTETLTARGQRAEALHGGMNQMQRDRVIRKLRDGKADLVIATDVAARGLDIEQLTHVINFDVPSAPEAYVHRIGRVGRAGREGVAITLAEPREHRLLRNIEHATKQKLDIARIPTVADMRARRLEFTAAAIREALTAGELDRFRTVVETLASEFDIVEVALAAVKVAHQVNAVGEDQDQEIAAPPPPRGDRFDRGNSDRGGSGGGEPRGRGGPRQRGGPGIVRLYVNVGRAAGVRPQDLVGAITGEAGVPGRAIGAIEIADRFSLVEVPQEMAPAIIEALGGARIKGKKVAARLDRDGA